jgi:hypothetical protein
MKTKIQLGLKYYGIGLILALLIITLIHAYSFLFDTYFAYAAWDVIVFAAVVSAVPFGFGLYVLHEKVNLLEWLKEWKRRK